MTKTYSNTNGENKHANFMHKGVKSTAGSDNQDSYGILEVK